MKQAAPHTIVARDSRDGRRGLIAEVHPEIASSPSEDELRAFEERVFYARVGAGMFFTSSRLIVVRDLLTAMTFAGNHYARTDLDLQDLLRRAGSALPVRELHDQVRSFMKLVPDIWMTSLPREAVAAMVPEVIGHLYEAELETFDGIFTDMAASA